jgi:hypothetical protein
MNSRRVLRSLISAALLTITAVISAHANDLTGSSSLSLPSSTDIMAQAPSEGGRIQFELKTLIYEALSK